MRCRYWTAPYDPRPRGRGPVEAAGGPSAAVRPLPIPDHVVGAPLKHALRPEEQPGLPPIPDHVVGAPLKLGEHVVRGAVVAPIPDHVVGAPLKHPDMPALSAGQRRSPTTWSGPR